MALDMIGSTIMFGIIGIGLFVLFAIILNFVTKGFVVKFLRAKASRGKLILLEVVTQTDNYFTLGHFEDNCLCYETRGGKKKRLTKVSRLNVESIMGVFRIKLDEQSDFAYLGGGDVPPADMLPDAEATDNVINRVMLAAGMNDPRLLWILICVVLILLIALVEVFMTSQAITAAKACQTLTATIK